MFQLEYILTDNTEFQNLKQGVQKTPRDTHLPNTLMD